MAMGRARASFLPSNFGAGWWKNTQYSNERDRREREFIACGVLCIVVVSFLFFVLYLGKIRSI